VVKTMSSLADRLLNAVVPKADAGACCPPDWYHEDKCAALGMRKYRDCHYTCQCEYVCTAWIWYSGFCPSP